MPTLEEHDVSTLSRAWLQYVTLAIGTVILCGVVFACSRLCAQWFCINSVVIFTKFCLNVLKRSLVSLPPIIKYLPAANGAGINHYILDLRPEYGTEIGRIITDIVGVLQHSSVDHPAPEEHPNHRRLTCKYDVRGWRRKPNERWKKKMKFFKRVVGRRKNTSSNNHQDESESVTSCQSEDTERNNYSNQQSFSTMESCFNSSTEEFVMEVQNSREKYSEEFSVVPWNDEDPTLEETIVYTTPIRKADLLKKKPDGTLVPHYTYEQ